MKKLTLFCLFFALFAIHKAHAQPTFYIDPPVTVANVGDQVCVSVVVQDFTNLIEVSFSLAYDEGVVNNPQISPVSLAGLPGFSTANIDVSMPGVITLEWNDGQPCETAVNGPTLPDDTPLFEVCFDAVGIYGNHTPVAFTDEPVDQLVRRSSANCIDIGEFPKNGYISLGTPPLTVNISSADGFAGDVVCLDFEVEDFDEIVSFQYGIFWDETTLQYVNATPSNLPEFTMANIGQSQAADGILNLSWWTTSDGVDVPDGTSILQVCFEILGDCGDQSEVMIAANPPAPIEVVNGISAGGTAGTDIGLLQTVGEVSVNCFDPNSITLNIEDKQVCPGESFTVDVDVADFQDITKLQFNLDWNPSVISLNNSPGNGVTYPDPGGCFNFGNAGNVSINPTQGSIEVDWSATGFGCDLNDGHTLMRLHFTAVGSGGTNSTISVVNPIFVDDFGGQPTNIGINNNNGLVEICELNSPTITASSATLNAGEQVCIEFDVQDFDDILRTQYTISWEPNVLANPVPSAFNLPGLAGFNFLTTQISQGVIGVEWENGTPVSVPDGTTIFEICFDVIGDPDDCGVIDFGDLPWAIDVETAESGGTNVGLNGQPGQVCVENPLDFFVSINDVFGSPGAEVCLDVTADGFVQLTQMQYSLNWNTSVLEYSSVNILGNLPNFTAASFDDSAALTDDGQLVIDWVSSNNLQGTTLPDGTALFQVCFTVMGNDGDCTGVNVSGQPSQIIINTAPTGNANLGMDSQPGSVCVNATIDVAQVVVTDVDCPSIPSGAIDLTIVGGSGDYDYQWTGFNVNPTSEDQSGLFPGDYFVTVTDAFNPALKEELEITVALAGSAPIADAGVDTTFNCFSEGLTLNGTGSSTGVNDVYLWEPGPGFPGVVNPTTDTTLTPEIFGGQTYILTVTNEVTGCVDRDTVNVMSSTIVNPEIMDMQVVLTCTTDTVMLFGTNSSFGFDISWTTDEGNIVSGMENQLTTMVTAPGDYFLTFSNEETGCSRSDTIFVPQDITEPIADAGSDGVIGCQDDQVVLDASASSNGAEYTYLWEPLADGEVCDDETTTAPMICSPGMYQLLVTNTVNGCTAMDMVEVVGDTLKPNADAGMDVDLDCVQTMVTLDAGSSSQGDDFAYTWTNASNMLVGDGLTLDVTEPGAYTFEVMNTVNGCNAISQVNVGDLTEDVIVEANQASNEITCDLEEAMLVWTGSAEGPQYTYQWQNEAGMNIADVDSIMVSEAGKYFLVIFNADNQCTGIDSVDVIGNNAPPMVDAGEEAQLGCVDFITLTGQVEAGNDNLIFQWQTSGVGCITNGTTLSPNVECAGMYTLLVEDTLTGCTNSDMVEVVANNTPPEATATAPNTVLPCDENGMTLTGTTTGTDVQIMWTSLSGSTILDDTTLTPTISEAGVYTLTVTSNLNNCTSTATVVVEVPEGPVADAGDNAQVDCLNTEATLSAANSTLNGTTLTWEALAGNDPADPNAVEITVGAGEYQLTVMDGNGCSAVDVVMVENIGDTPNVSAGDDVEKACDEEFATLNGMADAGLTYVWTDENDAVVGNDLTLEVAAAGTYTLTVFNTANNCENSASAIVTLAAAGEAAEASFDHDPCAAEAMLMGNLPEGTTGVWSPVSIGNVEEPTEAVTLATAFAEGENQFVWTLSLGTCIDYSSDTVTIVLDQSVPSALPDFVSLDELMDGKVSFNVLENDVFDAGTASFNLLDTINVIGTVSSTEDGTVSYAKERCFVGAVQLDYEICNLTCPDLCDQATLTIDVLASESEDCEGVPNAITPNDDGVNDALVFDALLANPDAPDNEIVIFNRWGDIVFQAKPYQNDWHGTNNSGKDLPQSTYYYILRIDIANGEILRGDVTVLK